MGAFVTFTAIIVLVPLSAEIRAADRNLRELISPILLAVGLLIAGLGLWFGPVDRQAGVAGIGVVLACSGLLLRPSGVAPESPPSVRAEPIVQKGSST